MSTLAETNERRPVLARRSRSSSGSTKAPRGIVSSTVGKKQKKGQTETPFYLNLPTPRLFLRDKLLQPNGMAHLSAQALAPWSEAVKTRSRSRQAIAFEKHIPYIEKKVKSTAQKRVKIINSSRQLAHTLGSLGRSVSNPHSSMRVRMCFEWSMVIPTKGIFLIFIP